MKKERPILYSKPMVIAINKDRKTKTRRIKGLEKINSDSRKWIYSHNSRDGHVPHPAIKYNTAPWYLFHPENTNGESWVVQCPYGQVGDILWVRENWRVKSWHPEDGEMVICFDTDDNETITCYDLNEDIFNRLWEQSCMDLADAGYEINPEENYSNYDEKDLRLRPSIHMPKEACRIYLKIVSVKIERLQDISNEDAISEGIEGLLADRANFGCRAAGMFLYRDYSRKDNSLKNYPHNGFDNPKTSFETLWESINNDPEKPEAHWSANPWVWVIEFKKTNKPETK